MMVAAGIGGGALSQSVQAHPPPAPENGVNESTYHRLWSGDADAFISDDEWEAMTGRERGPVATVANGTDLPFDRPPAAVEHWNRGELADVPPTGIDASAAPTDLEVHDGQFVADAFVAVLAVQPSTVARIRAGEMPTYVPEDGSVLGIVDYRVAVPEPVVLGAVTITHRLRSQRITSVRLLVDNEVESVRAGSAAVDLPYTGLSEYEGEIHTLTLEADVDVEFEREVREVVEVCSGEGEDQTCSTHVEYSHTYPGESVTVRDSVVVEEYDLSIAGWRTVYPNGDLGLVVYKSHPWLGYRVPDGSVHGVWRFYTARDPSWDTLTWRTQEGAEERHSPVHPLHVVAYPIVVGPTASPRERVAVVEAIGEWTEPSGLPDEVHLDALEAPYLATYGIVSRTRTTDYDLQSVTAEGLVRGVAVTPEERHFIDVPYHRSALSLNVVNTTAETVTVGVRLTDNATGDPLETDRRDGYVVVDGYRTNTTVNGTATLTIPREGDVVTAWYEPGVWWRNYPAYAGDSVMVSIDGGGGDLGSKLYRIGVQVGAFLIGVFLVDRATGWRIWPPWRWL